LQMDPEVVFDTTANHPRSASKPWHWLAPTARARRSSSSRLRWELCYARQKERPHPVAEADIRRVHEAVAVQQAQLPREGWGRILTVDSDPIGGVSSIGRGPRLPKSRLHLPRNSDGNRSCHAR
jgi:hypothetical protein